VYLYRLSATEALHHHQGRLYRLHGYGGATPLDPDGITPLALLDDLLLQVQHREEGVHFCWVQIIMGDRWIHKKTNNIKFQKQHGDGDLGFLSGLTFGFHGWCWSVARLCEVDI
jgi:hypothetical protein